MARIDMRFLLKNHMFGTTFKIDRLLLEDDLPTVFVSLQPTTSNGTYLRRGGRNDSITTGESTDEANRRAQEAGHDD